MQPRCKFGFTRATTFHHFQYKLLTLGRFARGVPLWYVLPFSPPRQPRKVPERALLSLRCYFIHRKEKPMSRQFFASIIALVTILSNVHVLDAQLIRRRGSDCGCQANSQQNFQVSRTNYRQPNYQQATRVNSQANYRAAGIRPNSISARQVPAGYYQQNRMLSSKPASAQRQQYVLVPHTQLRPSVPIQYSAARGCWVQAPALIPPTQDVLMPRLPAIANPSRVGADSYQMAPANMASTGVPLEIQSATYEAPLRSLPSLWRFRKKLRLSANRFPRQTLQQPRFSTTVLEKHAAGKVALLLSC